MTVTAIERARLADERAIQQERRRRNALLEIERMCERRSHEKAAIALIRKAARLDLTQLEVT